MGEASIKGASITGKYDPSVSASVPQMAREPFVKSRGQAHRSAVARPSGLCPAGQVNSHFGQWSTSREVRVPLWLPDTESTKVTLLIP